MKIQAAFFYLFSAVLLFAAFRVITARNPVHAVLHLILAFSQAAGIWLLLRAEFLGVALILVYLGAVMVLFLFVVMMLDIRLDALRQGFWRHFPLAALIGGVVIAEMGAVLMGGFGGVVERAASAAAQPLPNTQALGRLLYTEYLYPVEIAAMILLVAMIAAIALTLRKRKDSKAVDAARQIRVRAHERIELRKLAPARVPAPPMADGENADGQPEKTA